MLTPTLKLAMQGQLLNYLNKEYIQFDVHTFLDEIVDRSKDDLPADRIIADLAIEIIIQSGLTTSQRDLKYIYLDELPDESTILSFPYKNGNDRLFIYKPLRDVDKIAFGMVENYNMPES